MASDRPENRKSVKHAMLIIDSDEWVVVSTALLDGKRVAEERASSGHKQAADDAKRCQQVHDSLLTQIGRQYPGRVF